MAAKPEYIDLLNAIHLQERRAGEFLSAWSEKTSDPDLKYCLKFVAEREYSHGEIFGRRVRELGFTTQEIEDPMVAERMEVVSSDIPDSEKIAWLKEAQQRQPKPTVRERYEAAIDDESVDGLTRSLIKWFTEVENDSGALIRETYAKLEGQG